jgi:hypothetical protein
MAATAFAFRIARPFSPTPEKNAARQGKEKAWTKSSVQASKSFL